MLKYCSIGSGSSGNCHVVSYKDTGILIDAGLAGKRITSGIEQADFDIDKIQGIFITHEHSDHIKGAGIMSRKLDIPIYANFKTWCGMKDKIGNIKEENRPCVKTYKVMINRYLANFDFSLQKKDVFVVAYINLLYEIIAYRRNADDSVEGPAITDKESLIACIDYIIENKLESNKAYFKRAFEEIKKYEKLLEKCTIYHSALPESDMAYTLYIKVNKHNENYEKLLDLIEKSAFGKENSFVLKYMLEEFDWHRENELF